MARHSTGEPEAESRPCVRLSPPTSDMSSPILAAVLALAAPSGSEAHALALDPERSEIRFVVDATMHKVRGTAQLVSGELRIDPTVGALDGKLVIDARSADTGNRRRDRNMHEKVLRSEEFAEMTLTLESYRGAFDPEGSSELAVRGSLRLLDQDHEIEMDVTVEVEGEAAVIVGRVELPYVDWGLERPGGFVLKVGPVVAVDVELRGVLTPD